MKLIGMSRWFFILYFIPIVNLFFFALLSVMLANRFGKGAGFAIGILFLPMIFVPILAFSKCEMVAEEEEFEQEEDCIYCPECKAKLAEDAKVCFVCQKEIGKEEEKTEEVEVIEEKEDLKEDILKVEEKEETEENLVEEDLPSAVLFDDKELEDDEKENLLDLENILKELDQTKEEIKQDLEEIEEEIPEEEETITAEESKIEEVVEDKKSIDDILKVDETSYESKPYREKTFRSSTKTLDEILKINQDLYSSAKTESVSSKKEEIEILDLEPTTMEIEEKEPEVIEKKPENKVCPNCGSKVPSYSSYCIFCGEEVK